MTDTDPHPWCCARSLGFASECPLCPQYGTNAADRCPGHGLNDANQAVIETARLHAEHRHPGYEYRVTVGPRKQWDGIDRPPTDEDGEPDPSWERNVDAGWPGQGWDRFDYTEESYWRRKKTAPQPLYGPEGGQETHGGGAEGPDGDSGSQEAMGDPELTAEEARALVDELGLDLYRAQDALAFVEECCAIADRESRTITTADVREWLKGARCGRQLISDTGPSVREAAADDRRWFNGEREGE